MDQGWDHATRMEWWYTSQGTRVMVEGGPALSDFDRLITELSEALKATLGDADKLSRFADRVLGEGAAASEMEALKGRLEKESAALAARVRVNRPPHANGYGRLDAFGNNPVGELNESRFG